MIQMIFSVKFQSQLQRTRPYLYDSLKKSIVASVDGSGGRIRRCFHSIIADFNENEIGFWIDILTVLGNGYQAIEKNKRELFGYLCVLSENMDDSAVSLLMKTLPSQVQASGIWCSSHVRAALGSFAEFSTKDYAISVNSQMNSFSEIESIKTESYTSCKNPLLDKVSAIIEKDRIQNTVLTGAKYIGKRECLHWYCDNFEQDTVPLTIRFGKYIGGLCCFVDALSPAIRHFLTPPVDAKPGNEELFMLHEQLFRERLRVEPSKYTLRIGRRYVYLLLNAYCERALSEGKTPIVILENIQKVPYDAAQIFSDIYRETTQDRQLVLYATCSSQTIPSLFKDFFPRIINCSHDHIPVFTAGNISLSLWEIAYACYLFGKYFPPYDFLDLFCAEGKNKDTIRKILYLLYQRNIIRSIEAPNPELIAFREGVEKILGERAAYIRAMVKNRLLAWISDRKVVPCYNLLEALHSFGLDISDSLALEAIRSDLMNDAFKSIENSIIDGSFYAVVGNERAAALQYCFRSLKALLFGSGEFIKESARNLKREDSPTPLYKSQILIIDAAFKMALRDISGALAAAKEAMMIIQGSKEKKEIAQVYRLFALVHLSRKELPDAVEYLSFSVEEAEAHKDASELAVSLYYAATAHFLLGNLSKAERLVKQAELSARIAGRPEWALRSLFFLGRCYFESGRYKNAISIFQSLLENTTDTLSPACRETLDAWIFRSKLYLYENIPPLPENMNADALLFKLEGLYLVGEYDEAIKLSDEILSEISEKEFLLIEQPDWSSGFAQCELLEFSPDEFWFRMVMVWRSLALCRAEPQDSREAVVSIQKIMSGERFCDYDPHAPFCFFANYRVLNETGAGEIDRNTAVGMAFKRLQLRAGRIDDSETRRAFLSNQYWNKILFNTAKEYKLI